jgi:O-antigen ligase
MEAFYILIAIITALVSIAKPHYGIIFLLFNFQLQPHAILGFQQSTTQLTNILIGAILFLKLPFYKIKNPETGASLLAILFFISAVVSSLLNFGFDFVSNEDQIDILRYFLNRVGFLFLFMRYICTRKIFTFTFKTLVVLGSASAVYTIYDWMFRVPLNVNTKIARAVGVVGDPNHLSANLTGLLPLAYYLFLHGTSKRLKQFNIFAIASLILGVFYSVSRGGLLTLAIIGGWITKKNLKKYSTLIVLGGIVIFFSLYVKDLYSKRVTVRTSFSGRTSLDDSSSQRIEIIKYGLQLWIRNPMFGIGAENTVRSVSKILNIHGNTNSIHNIYVLVLTEFGLVGFLLYMGLFVLAFKSLSRLSRHQDAYFNEIAVYLRIALVSHMISSCFIGNWVELMLWITIALPILLDQISKNEQKTALQR